MVSEVGFEPTPTYVDQDSCTSFEFEVNVLTTIPISDDKLHLLQTETRSDPVLQHLMQLCTDGWPDDRSKVPAQCLPF